MSDWETLKKLTGSKFAQHAILVPIVGWLLVYQNTFADLVSSTLGLNVAASLSWQVLLFYLGLVAIGIASALFRIVGPEEVLNYSGLQGFIEDTEAVLTRKEFILLCETSEQEVPEEITVTTAGTGQASTRETWLRLNSETIRDALANIYRKANSDAIEWRVTIFVTFILGAVLTIVPTVTTVVWVIQQLFNNP